MSWFKKKEKEIIEEEIPELPELPKPDEFSLPDLSIPNFNQEEKNLLQLPQLPELKEAPVHPMTLKQEIINSPQEMQRSRYGIIENKPIDSRYGIIENKPIDSHFGVIENKQKQEPRPIRRSQEITEINPGPNTQIKNAEPIYVRLDKFETSLQSIEEVKRKIAEIEHILKKTKEIKQKEEQELEAWEREIHIIKSRIDSVDKTIFNKLD